ncbi:MAG: porB2 [Spirochaetes bacterium]|nr:MAG: porB2 [Spirochaetota bacterium]
MSAQFLATDSLPFCKGCGHSLVAKGIGQALDAIQGLSPRDVIVVTDIGCIGIIDKEFATHTIHGLHGRSIALASGIRLGLENPGKKIIVLLGDGGATIGMQHLLDAAHRNLDLKVIVHNNMLYGMTGGQPSSLTPCGYKTSIMPEGKADAGIDLVALVAAAGAPMAMRTIASAAMSAQIGDLLAAEGFAFLEVLELCTSHGVKLNPGKSVAAIAKEAGLELKILRNPHASPATILTEVRPSLLEKISPIAREWQRGLPWTQKADRSPSNTARRISIVLAGSAGEGVQTSAEILAQAAMSCGLHVSKKGSYPVTVGIGFSMAEVIISEAPIRYTGAGSPDVLLICSEDGLEKVKGLLNAKGRGMVYLDATLEPAFRRFLGHASDASLQIRAYREIAGAKSALLAAVSHYLRREGELPLEAFEASIRRHMGEKTNLDAIMKDFEA